MREESVIGNLLEDCGTTPAQEQTDGGTLPAELHHRAPPNGFAATRGGRMRVLIVEDEYLIAEDIAATFREIGVDVVGPTGSVPCAHRLVEENVIDAALLDIWARDDLVFSVADALTERQIPFAFVTGLPGAEMPERFKEARLWLKPFDVQLMAREVLALCGAGSPK